MDSVSSITSVEAKLARNLRTPYHQGAYAMAYGELLAVAQELERERTVVTRELDRLVERLGSVARGEL
jgi:hypothetical protein